MHKGQVYSLCKVATTFDARNSEDSPGPYSDGLMELDAKRQASRGVQHVGQICIGCVISAAKVHGVANLIACSVG